MTIEELFNSIPDENIVKTNGTEIVKKVDDMEIESIDYEDNTTHSKYTKINYVMKHSVKKHMFQIITNTDTLKLTNDHSIMIVRTDDEENVEYMSVKTTELTENDYLIKVLSNGEIYYTKQWTLTDLGEQEIDVYDVETENHTFIGNNFLCHNSFYLDINDVLDIYKEKHKDCTREMCRKFVEKYCDLITNDALMPLFNRICHQLNTVCDEKGNNNIMFMDREAIAIPSMKTGRCGLWTAKKHYILLLDQNEEIIYNSPHKKIIGLESVKSTMAEFIKPIYNKILEEMITENEDVARKTLSDFKKEFYAKSISDIAIPVCVSRVNKFRDPSTNLPWVGEWFDVDSQKTRNGGVPIMSTCSINYNYLLDKFNLKNKRIGDGDHIKYIFLKDNPYHLEVIALDIENINLPKEFKLDKYVDYDAHWKKMIEKPISDAFEACGLELEKKLTLDDLF